MRTRAYYHCSDVMWPFILDGLWLRRTHLSCFRKSGGNPSSKTFSQDLSRRKYNFLLESE
jgi:hypothetical protein